MKKPRTVWSGAFCGEGAKGLFFLFRRGDGTDLDVAEGDLSVVALEGDVAATFLGEILHAAEFGLGDALVEVVAAQYVFEVFYAIDLVDAFLGGNEQAHLVPLAGGLGSVERLAGLGIDGRLVEAVEPAAAVGVFG